MSITTSDMTPADIAAVTGNNCNNDSWGGSWSSWIIIFLIFAMFGWGGFGNGFGGNGAGTADNYVLASDFATLQRQIDSATSSLERKGDAINSGLCDGFYAMNTSLLNGFAATNNAIQTSGYETRNAIQQSQITEMQNANAIQSQLAASQQAQNGYLLSQLKQCPVPAYVVANPYSSPCCNGFNTCCNN